jgi:two-component system response regulator AtoC
MGLVILLVEDDLSFAKHLARFLVKEGHEVEHASSGEDGVRLFQDKTPDIVLLDLMLPDIGGLQVLEQIKKLDDSSAVIVMTAHGSITTAVDAIHLGALDYITKPIDLEALEIKLDQARQIQGMRSDLGYLLDRERRGTDFETFIGSSSKMRAVYEKIDEVAKTDNTTVLITGPSGTGKELVSRAVHARSARSNKPLMQIDCTAIPYSLMESELFGHERGAFTGADRMKKGLLELADGGTLLLDEIGDMELALQGKFLRVLQERQFRRVGGTRDLRFDVRVIAATNQDLDRLSVEKRFRSDLLYRLKVFQIELPLLKDRGNDVLELADSFIKLHARSFRKNIKGLDAEASQLLREYSFPGNVRELRNIIEQAVILAKGAYITPDLLPVSRPTPKSSPPGSPTEFDADGEGVVEHMILSLDSLGDKPLQTAESELITQALRKSGGSNKVQAAKMLGISRFALKRKLEKLTVDLLTLDKK